MSKFTTIASTVTAVLIATGAHAQSNLSAETATPVSVSGNTIMGLSEVASEAGVANIQVATDQTLTNVLQNVAEGKTDIGATAFILPFLMSKGLGPYATLGEEAGSELAAQTAVLYTYRLALFAMTSYESSKFSGYDAIKGATIYNGPPRGAALNRARAMVKLATGLDEGPDYTGIQVNWGQVVQTITDGSADAFLLPMQLPDATASTVSAAGAMIVHSFPKEVFESEAAQRYARAPGTAAVVTEITPSMFSPNHTVLSEDNMFRGYADIGGDVVNVSMNEETAYGLTKSFIEGMDRIKARAPLMPGAWLGETEASITGMCESMPMKYHPGAVRAWEEAGYTLPDCAKP